MSLRNTVRDWGTVSRVLHWISALVLLGMLADGWWMTHLVAREGRLAQYGLHAMAGVYFGLLLALRLAWRSSEVTPAYPIESSPWQQAAARIAHVGLYLLMLAVVVSGWLQWSAFARRSEVLLLGVVKVPFVFAEPNRQIAKTFESAHELLAYGLLALALIHIGAALWHHFVKRNDVLSRMAGGGIRA